MEINEEILISLIISAGEAKSCAMEAICAARHGQWDKVPALLKQSDDAARECHCAQTRMIGEDEGCGKIPVSLIMVHAQDHIMNAMLCREMAEELICLYRKFNSLTSQSKDV